MQLIFLKFLWKSLALYEFEITLYSCLSYGARANAFHGPAVPTYGTK